VIENSKTLDAGKERGLIAYPFAQFVEASVAHKTVENAGSSWKSKAYSETPFVTQSRGKYSLVQTWPTKFNAKFKEDFECKEANTDTKHFEPGAVQAFKTCVEILFGQGATDNSRIQHCHKVTVNNFPCYVGLTESLKDHLKKNPAEMMQVGIKELTLDGFVSTEKDGRDNPAEKPFKFEKKPKSRLGDHGLLQISAIVCCVHDTLRLILLKRLESCLKACVQCERRRIHVLSYRDVA